LIERLRRLAPTGGRLHTWGPRVLAWIFFLLVPYAVLWRFAPGGPTTIGNDYVVYPIDAQLEYVWSWSHGIWPLFMPGFAGGTSASAMTLGQAWHPITWLCALTPGYRTGSAEVIVTVYRYLELGIVHHLLYRESRARALPRWAAFLVTLAVVFNTRMLDSFRYGASLESYCGMLLACHAFCAAYRLGWTPRRVAWAAFTIYLTLVALLPVAPGEGVRRGRFLGGVAVSGLIGGGLAAGYLAPFAVEFLGQNAGRVGQDYAFTAGFSDTVRGTVANFFRPLESDVHGAFGGSALPLVLVCYVALALVGSRKPWPVLVPALLMAVTLLFALGKSTPFHRLVVEHIPGFSSFRVPGRANLMVPPLLLLIAWAAFDGDRAELRRRVFARVPLLALAGVAALLAHVAFQLLAPTIEVAGYSPLLFSGSPAWVDGALVALFAATTLSLALAAWQRPSVSPTASILCLLAVVGSSAIALPYGTWRTKRKPTRTFEKLDAHHAEHLLFWGDPGFGMESRQVLRARAAGLALDRPAGALHEHWATAESDEAAVPAAVSGSGELFLTGPAVEPRPGDGAGDPEAVKLEAAHWNRWTFTVDAPRGGAFVLGQPALPQWRATVDGAAAPVVTADGTFPAVVLAPGRHQVELRFVSVASVVGAVVTAATLLGIVIARHRLRSQRSVRARAITGALAVLVLLALFLFSRGLWPAWDMRSVDVKAAKAAKAAKARK
jgi:hypothetical protein